MESIGAKLSYNVGKERHLVDKMKPKHLYNRGRCCWVDLAMEKTQLENILTKAECG